MILGSLLRPVVPGFAAALVVIAALVLIAGREAGLYRLPLPQNARQVPQSVVAAGGRVGGLRFGFELGTGVRTFMTSGLPHMLFLAVLLTAGWPQGLLAGVCFGAGRSWMALSRLWYGDSDAWDDELARHDRLIRVVLTVAAAGAVSALVWPPLTAP